MIAGPTPGDVVRRYSALTGRTPIPRWSLGYHQSRWGYPDAARIDELAGELRARELPSDALWLDSIRGRRRRRRGRARAARVR